MTFHDQVVFITGGSSGIGLATARAFARAGARVWLVARDPSHLALLGDWKFAVLDGLIARARQKQRSHDPRRS